MHNDQLLEAMELLETVEVQTTASLSVSQQVSQKNYKNILKHLNVTSFSQLEIFYKCPRKFQKKKEQAAFQQIADLSTVDFSFGHAVGSGIQEFLISGDLDKALMQCLLSWRVDFDATIAKKRKNIWGAMIAVEKFAGTVLPHQLGDWELLILPSGKPAIETSFSFHCGNGFKHYCHMDIGLRNKVTGRVMIVDCKTTGFNDAEESLYANSTQALSYAIMIETCLPEQLMDYEVMYLVYSSTEREWTPLVFTKSSLDQAEWIKDLLLTQDLIKTYADVNFFPKRGNACYEYFRRCEYYGECNTTADQRLPELASGDEAEQTDYVIHLQSVIDELKNRRNS